MKKNDTKSILLVGVGGQGTILASKIRILVETTCSIPAWHGARGEKGWLFVDEISIK